MSSSSVKDLPNKPHCEKCGKLMSWNDLQKGTRDYVCLECSKKEKGKKGNARKVKE